MAMKKRDKLAIWCQGLVNGAKLWPDKESTPNYKNLKPHHIDILLSSSVLYDVYSTFTNIDKLTPSQIEFGLSYEDRNVRLLALNHPCCTEAQKVKYHLGRGE